MASRRIILVALAALAPFTMAFGPGILSGNESGAPPTVHLQDPLGGTIYNFMAFDPAHAFGVNVAKADVDGDGIPDMVVGSGPGGAPQVRVFAGSTGLQVADFFAFDPGFTGGVNVATGDVNGDGFNDIIAGAGPGGQPAVRVFNFADIGGGHISNFLAYDPAFSGGVFVGAGDVNGDGRDEIITGPGVGGTPQVNVFDGVSGTFMQGFFAYTGGFAGGVRVAGGDLDGDGREDIIVGPHSGQAPVCVFMAPTLGFRNAFNPYGTPFANGIRIAALDINGDGGDDIITGPGVGGGPHVRVFDGSDFGPLTPPELQPFGLGHTSGISVGGGQLHVDSFFDIFYNVPINPPPAIPVEIVMMNLGGTVLERDFRLFDPGTPTRVWTANGFSNFNFYLKGFNTLGVQINNVGVFGGGTVPPQQLVLGDLDGNDSINIADFGLLRNAFGSASGDPSFLPQADLNGDGSVNIQDFVIFRQGFGQSGPGRP
ncbi:MAG: FG-GAP repeat protein [Fimbriimonadaceae bacterium]|nr:FG-GAP repeat protein [Fimbriimonadaceae bacterium]